MAAFQHLYACDEAQTARTPKAMFTALDAVYFHGKHPFDVCPTSPAFDGLSITWKALNYCNPPFRALPDWADKAVAEAKKNHETILLMPARFNTKYFFRMLDTAHSIAIWCTPVTFLPFKDTFKLCVLTVQFGGVARSLSPHIPNMGARRIKADAWTFDKDTTLNKLWKRVSSTFAGVTRCDFKKVKKTGASYVALTSHFAESVGYVIEHCNTYPDAVVILETITMFQAPYFAPAFSLIQKVIFYEPNLSLQGLKCFASNQLVVLSKRAVVSPNTRAVPPVWLLRTNARAISDSL